MIGDLQEWPNGLGVDIGDAEIWKHADAFRVFTPARVLRVPYAVTTDPRTALELCEREGLLIRELEELDPREADRRYFAAAPTQKELF